MDHIKNLLALQAAEIIIDDIRSDAQVYPDQLSRAQKEFDQNKAEFDEAKTRLAALEAEAADLKHTLELEEQRLEKSRKKTRELTKVYEVQAMKKEIDSTEKSNVELKEKIEHKTQEVENAKETLQKVEASFEEVEKKLSETKTSVETKMGEVDEVLSSKLSEKKELETKCDKAILNSYRMIRDRKYQDALVPVVDGACQGCFMNIPPQMANLMLQNPNQVEHCPNCQRLIYWHANEEHED